MRRPSIVVLLAVVVLTPAGWSGAAVLAQPAAHHRSSATAPPSSAASPFRSLARGGYSPGSATRAPSGPAQLVGEAEATASGRRASGGAEGGAAGSATRPSQLLDLRTA